MTDQHQHRAPINLNHEVKVKLTDSGQDVLAMQQLRRQQDADGYIKFQLWELMNIFGSYVYNGCSIPFEFNRILLAPFNPAMTDQLRARVEALEELHKAVVDLNERFNLDPLVARVEALEASQHAHIEAKSSEAAAVDQVLALQDQIRDGTLTLADALEKINGDDQPVQQFIPKYLFTDGNIQQDSFCYDPSDSNSVSFDIANLEPVHGCLKPGDNIKIAHRWGELPASGVYSTINYKVASVSETENRAWTIRAVRVDTSDSEPAPTADDQLTLVDRVIHAINPSLTPIFRSDRDEARAAIREVAEWLRSEYPQREGFGTVWANLLDNEANC
jgi:anti-sigma factor ChrR (cupin superfamily)